MESIVFAVFPLGIALISHLSARAACVADPNVDYLTNMLGGWIFGRLANGWRTWVVTVAWTLACGAALWAALSRGQ